MKQSKKIDKTVNILLILYIIWILSSVFFLYDKNYYLEISLIIFPLLCLLFNIFKGIYKSDPFYKELKIRKVKFFNLINKLSEPLIIVNKKNKIKVVNKSFEKIFDSINLRKKQLEGLNDITNVLKFIKKIYTLKNNNIQEISINNKTYLCSGIYIGDTEEVLVVFHDINDRIVVENMKRDFIHNMSHELKTPLTSIAGFTETLLEEINEEEHISYLKIIKRNTDRLSLMVKKLLTISDMEYNNHINRKKVYIKNIIDQIIEIIQSKKNIKKIQFYNNIPENVFILGDIFKLEQIFINLIENAYKYTEQGTIYIDSETFEDKVIIKIKDTGIGIDEKYIERVFERFFVVSKSRSKRKGGTGLGLSIVKHAVLAHNGTIDLKSKLGKGSEFILEFPLK